LIHALESFVITPFAVGTRLTINPLLIIASLVFWYWMWGIVGALLSVPILVCIKVGLDRIEGSKSWARIFD
jgi:predicted PurR-regulated permease PerM